MEEHEKIELRSDDVQEIIGTPPRWIVRWGTLIVSSAVIAIVAMSFFVEYPDKVIGEVIVTTKIAPVRVNARQSGNIDELFVEDGAKVEIGDVLLVMQDAADYLDVDDLEELMEDFQDWNKAELYEYDPNEFPELSLGNLQPLYSQLQTDFKSFQFFEQSQAGSKQVSGIRNQISEIRSSIKILEKQKKSAEDVVKFHEKRYEEFIDLVKNGSLARKFLEDQGVEVLNAKAKVQNLEDQISDRGLNISGLSGQIQTIQSSSSESTNDKYTKLQSSINVLISAMDRWNEDNIVLSSIDGKISMVNNWSERQYINQGTEIMAILPDNMEDDNLFVQLFIPITGSGKVEIGQRVLLKFANYPYREFGQVDAEVVDLPGLQRDNRWPVRIKLTNGLKTRSGKTLKFEQEMRGRGDIITENRTVFTRIFENIIKPFMDNE